MIEININQEMDTNEFCFGIATHNQCHKLDLRKGYYGLSYQQVCETPYQRFLNAWLSGNKQDWCKELIAFYEDYRLAHNRLHSRVVSYNQFRKCVLNGLKACSKPYHNVRQTDYQENK